MIKLYIQGLTNYNGDWFDVDTVENFDNFLATTLKGNEEYEVCDYEYDTNLEGVLIRSNYYIYMNVHSFIEKVEKMNDAIENISDEDVISAIMEETGCDLYKAIETYNNGDYIVLHGKDEKDCVWSALDEGLISYNPSYIDEDALKRDLEIEDYDDSIEDYQDYIDNMEEDVLKGYFENGSYIDIDCISNDLSCDGFSYYHDYGMLIRVF